VLSRKEDEGWTHGGEREKKRGGESNRGKWWSGKSKSHTSNSTKMILTRQGGVLRRTLANGNNGVNVVYNQVRRKGKAISRSHAAVRGEKEGRCQGKTDGPEIREGEEEELKGRTPSGTGKLVGCNGRLAQCELRHVHIGKERVV